MEKKFSLLLSRTKLERSSIGNIGYHTLMESMSEVFLQKKVQLSERSPKARRSMFLLYRTGGDMSARIVVSSHYSTAAVPLLLIKPSADTIDKLHKDLQKNMHTLTHRGYVANTSRGV